MTHLSLRSVLTERVHNLIINVMVGADNDAPDRISVC